MKFIHKFSFGHDRYYPDDDCSELLMKIVKPQTTLTAEQLDTLIEIAEKLQFEIKVRGKHDRG